ncbi:hypothetical protein APR49_09560, partial [Variovorax paradoxus]|uniref:hypothetical protein n=3 Tax=Variovorax paradoxus TaxID=34073 RepID=UPI0006E5440F
MTTDIHAATQAIREALAAGPTPGPWLEKGRVNPSREAIRIESHHPADEHHLYQVCDVLDANGYPRNQANLQFIAACNPEAITTILAALEARDAEIAALTGLLVGLVEQLDDGDDQVPGHCHAKPGIWDEHNGEKSGTPCALCALWTLAKGYAASPQPQPPPRY